MAESNDDKNEDKDLFKTTFIEKVDYKVGDKISESFLKTMMEEIAKRSGVSSSELRLELSAENYTIQTKSSELSKILKDAEKYSRVIKNIGISSGVVYRSDEDDRGRDHHDIKFELNRYDKSFLADVRVYGVSEKSGTSQEIIDWGNGVVKGFNAFKVSEKSVKASELVINSTNGRVEELIIEGNIQKVQVINKVSIKDTLWYKNPQFIFGFIALACVVIGWIWFSPK